MPGSFNEEQAIMSAIQPQEFAVPEEFSGTILAAIRQQVPDTSWSAARKLLQSRKVAINGVLCVDEGRRPAAGEQIAIGNRPWPEPPTDRDVIVRYVDNDIVIAEKPSGMLTLRRTSELSWSAQRKQMAPTLDECVPRMIAAHAAKRRNRRLKQKTPRLFSVHRIDRDTSGLLVFARNEQAQKAIIEQFAQHAAVRKYFAVVPGHIEDQTIQSQFIRDRGDGLRGSTTDTSVGQHAVTHVRTLRQMGRYSELECRLETGRTNQIRIHLAELGVPVCGDIKYRGAFGQPPIVDDSKAPRLALHAAQLRFTHPTTGDIIDFETPWPVDMQRFLNRIEADSRSERGSHK